MALRKAGWHVSGADTDPDRLAQAQAIGAIDRTGIDPNSQITFVATAVSQIHEAVAEALAATSGWVTDVGSVKAPLLADMNDPRFVGGHPMAGSEQEGIAGARADMFEGAIWVLTPTPATSDDAYIAVRSAIAGMGAEIVTLSPERHDELVALISHVPHLTAATLMLLAEEHAEQRQQLQRLAAGGFRDMTRIAAGHPGIWPDICIENSDAICEGLDSLIAALGEGAQRRGASRPSAPDGSPQPSPLSPSQLARHGRGGRRDGGASGGDSRPTRRDSPPHRHSFRPAGEHPRLGDSPLSRRRAGRAGDAVGCRRSRQAAAAVGRSRRPLRHPPCGAMRIEGGSPLRGSVRPPGDKSISHRALILSALAEGESQIFGLSDGEDVKHTAGALSAMGAEINLPDDLGSAEAEVRVIGRHLSEPAEPLYLGNSGTSMRLLAGVCAAHPMNVVLDGDESLRSRPMGRIAEPLSFMGATVAKSADAHATNPTTADPQAQFPECFPCCETRFTCSAKPHRSDSHNRRQPLRH